MPDETEGNIVTRDELAMLEFAITWAPFGGGDEHILSRFGILPAVFYLRLQCLLARHTGVNISVRRRLNELCTLKLDTLQAHCSDNTPAQWRSRPRDALIGNSDRKLGR